MKGVVKPIIGLALAIALVLALLLIPTKSPTGLQVTNQPPLYDGTAFTTTDTLTVNLAQHFVDPEGDLVSLSTNDPNAKLESGILTFTPPTNYSGEYLLSIEVSDGANTVYKPIMIEVVGSGTKDVGNEDEGRRIKEEETAVPNRAAQLVIVPATTETTPELSPSEPAIISDITISAACGSPITACCDITSSGYYALGDNITNTSTCIAISANDVTLDCAGFTINYSTSTSGNGIFVDGRNNVTISNCTIVKESAAPASAHGILFTNTGNSTIFNTTSTVTGAGSDAIQITGDGHNNTLANVTGISASAEGIEISTSDNNTIENSQGIATGAGYGISIATGTNFNILINNTGTSNTFSGLMLFSSSNNTLTNNTATSDSNIGLYVSASSDNRLIQNTARSNTGAGLVSDGGSVNNTFMHNVVRSRTNFGLRLLSSSSNTLTNNTVASNTGTTLNFLASQNNALVNTTLMANITWLTTDATSTGNNLTNTTFDNPVNGSILIINTTTIPASTTVGLRNLTIRNNSAFLNSTNLTFLNTTAQITLNGIPTANTHTHVDFEDDGTFTECIAPQCVNESFAAGVKVFNVTSFTTYTTSSSAACPGTIMTSTNLTENVSSTGTCITIGADNIVLDCNGFTINYSSTIAGNGIFASSGNNITLKNCIINQVTATAGSHGMSLTLNNSIVFNNSVLTIGTTSDALLLSANNNTVANNTLRSLLALALETGSGTNNTIVNNTLNTTSTNGVSLSASGTIFSANNLNSTSARGLLIGSTGNIIDGNTILSVGSHGMEVSSDQNTIRNNIVRGRTGAGITGMASYNNFTNNVVTSTSNQAFSFSSSNHNLIINNTVHSNGSSAIIFFTSTNNTFLNNTALSNIGQAVQLTGTTSSVLSGNTITSNITALLLSSSANFNIVQNNTITSNIQSIYLISSSNNTFVNNSANGNNTALRLQSASDNAFNMTMLQTNNTWVSDDSTSVGNNLTNTTFLEFINGSITVLNRTTIPASTFVTLTKLFVRSNQAFLNSTNLTFLNTSAQITLHNLTFTNPRARVDFEDDGTFVTCSAPQCVNDSYNGSTFVFNVTSFTTYAASETAVQCGDTITTDTNLTENITGTGTCLTIGADNVALDCAGFTINYSNTANGSGVNATDRNNITIQNCRIFQGNSSLTNAPAILFSATTNSSILHSNLNATGIASEGLRLITGATNNTIRNNTLAGDGNAGAGVYSTGNLLVNNTIVSNTGRGIDVQASSTTIVNNSVTGVISLGSNDNVVRTNIATGRPGGVGIFTTGSFNIIENNNATSPDNDAIFINGNDNNITNNRATGSNGLRVLDATRNTITGNTLRSESTRALLLSSSSNNNLTDNTLSTNTGTALEFSGTSQNNTLTQTTLYTNNTWIITRENSTGNNLTNVTFNTTDGSIRIFNTTLIPATINQTGLNITFNNAFLNSTNLTFLNTSAQITLLNLTFTNPQIFVDYEDDGTYTTCTDCTRDSFAGGILVFNVTHFTSFQGNESTCATMTTCAATAGNTCTLITNVNSTGTCITVGANNVTVDCAGNSIFYDGGGTGGDGITATSRNNITIKNCFIRDVNASGASGIGILIITTTNSTIQNNTIQSNGTNDNYGILLSTSANNNTITNNTINTQGSSTANYGTFLSSSSTNTVTQNTITTNGTSDNYGILLDTSANNTFTSNNITTQGTSTNYGILLVTSANNNTITNNTINTRGSSSNNYGTYIQSSSTNTITQNTITTNGTSSNFGIQLQTSANNNTFISNNITTQGTTSYGIKITTSNNSFFNNTILNNPVQWILAETTTNNNFTNTLFVGQNGSIRITPTINITGTQDITQSKLNITFNKAFLNSTNLTFLNTSGQITLTGLNQFSSPAILVDYEDDGTYTTCTDCTRDSFSAGTLVFNVTHFTSFQGNESTCAGMTTCAATAGNTCTLITNVNSTGTCITVGANNVIVDCAGFTINYSNTATGNGINATSRSNVTIKNCNVVQGNATASSSAIFLSGTTNSMVQNNSLNVTGAGSQGIHLQSSSNNNVLANNTAISNNTGSGILVASSSNNNNLTNNTARSSSGQGILFGVTNTILRNNTGISDTGSGILLQGGANNQFINNTAISNSSHGILIQLTTNATLTNNTGIADSGTGITINSPSILTNNRGTSNTGAGIALATTDSNNSRLENNVGTSTSLYGIQLEATSHNTIINNSGTGILGIFVRGVSLNNTLINNTGTGTSSTGLRVEGLSNNNQIIQNRGTGTHGLNIQNSQNNTFSNNTFSGSLTGMFFDSTAQNNTFQNTTLQTNTTWISTDATSSGNNITNTTFDNPVNGSILIINTTTIPASTTVGLRNLTIRNNSAFLNSTNLTFLNTSAQITLLNLTFTNPQIFVDYEDDGTYTTCTDCTRDSFAGGILVFNVTHFTSFQGNESTCAGMTTCAATAGNTCTLITNVNSTGTCITVGANNVIVDCAGFTINYSNTATGNGALASSRNNVTVRNCRIIQGNASISSAHAISFSTTSNSRVLNNTVNATGSSSIGINLVGLSNNNQLMNNTAISNSNYGIFIQGSSNNNLTNNTATSRNGIFIFSGSNNNQLTNNTATSTSGPGITLESGSDNNQLTNNTAISDSNYGIHIVSSSTNNRLTNNMATSNSNRAIFLQANANNNQLTNNTAISSTFRGIALDSSSNNNLTQNTATGGTYGIQTVLSNNNQLTYNTATSNTGIGISIETISNNNQLTNNTATSNTGNGILIFDRSNNNQLTNNTATSNTAGALIFSTSAQNNTATGTILIANATWFAAIDASTGNNISNTTFNNPVNGSILIINRTTIPASASVTVNNLAIRNNSAFLNSTTASFLNTSAQITLTGLNATTARPIVDFNDDGKFEYCDAPQCTLISFTGGTIVYNVTSFTTYSSSGNITVDKSDIDPATRGGQLNYTITINNTGSDTAFNITITESYPAGTTFNSATPAPTSGNNLFTLGNLTGGNFTTINITVNVSSALANGTALNNSIQISFQNFQGINTTLNDSELTTVTGFPIVFTTKTGTPDPVARGTPLAYQITILNAGDEIAYNTTITEGYPVNTTFVTSSPTNTSGNNTFAIGTLTPGQFTTINITLNTSRGIPNGTILNNTYNVTFANITGQNLTITNNTLTTVLGSPVIVNIKSDTPDPVVKGTQLSYIIQVNNTGDDFAFNLTVVDTYPAGVTFHNSSPLPNSSNNTFVIGTLTPGQATTINITVNVSIALANATILNNTAIATFQNSTGENGSVTDSELTTVIGFPIISATKTDIPDPIIAGNTLAYQITIANTGDMPATGVTVIEAYPALVTFNGSQPVNTSGNNTFAVGTIQPGSFIVNITVNVSTLAANSIINNTATITFTNTTGQNFTIATTASTTVNAPPAPTGGGGGGGATRSVPAPVREFAMDQELITQPLRNGDVLTFAIDSETHTLTIISVTKNAVTLLVQSTPQYFTMRIGEQRIIDANLDGYADLQVKVEGIMDYKAILRVKKIPQPTREDEGRRMKDVGEDEGRRMKDVGEDEGAKDVGGRTKEEETQQVLKSRVIEPIVQTAGQIAEKLPNVRETINIKILLGAALVAILAIFMFTLTRHPPRMPKLPEIHLPHMPKLPRMALPRPHMPKLPRVSLPNLPHISLPKLPHISLPRPHMPKLPHISIPHFTKQVDTPPANKAATKKLKNLEKEIADMDKLLKKYEKKLKK